MRLRFTSRFLGRVKGKVEHADSPLEYDRARLVHKGEAMVGPFPDSHVGPACR